jgi:hypothetical protein
MKQARHRASGQKREKTKHGTKHNIRLRGEALASLFGSDASKSEQDSMRDSSKA